MPTETRTNYLAKLLTLLIKRNGNTISIPIQDLMTDDIGQGFQVYFNQETKELVLTFVPAGATTYKIEGATTWLNNLPLPQSPQSPRPLTQEQLVERAWTESAATPTLSETRQPSPRSKVIHLTSETMAEAEDLKLKAAALREIENFDPRQRTAPVQPPSRQATTFFKP